MHLPRHTVTITVVLAIHVLAAAFLLAGHAAGAVPPALAGFAYTRGLLHALDADHLCMIDGSTRKLLGERRNPNGVVWPSASATPRWCSPRGWQWCSGRPG